MRQSFKCDLQVPSAEGTNGGSLPEFVAALTRAWSGSKKAAFLRRRLLEKLTLVNADTGDQVTRWLFGTTLADSAIASNGLVRAKIYPESDDRPAPASDGPDGVYSRLEYQYNRQGQQTQFKDADGTTHEYAYNKLGRMTEDRVTVLANGLDNSVRRIGYAYDNRSLVAKVTSYNTATGGTVVNEAAFEYDSFLQLAADKQSHAGAVTGTTPKVTYAYETGGVKNTTRRVSTTYPTSSRILEVQYGTANSMDDHLGRVSALKVNGESGNLVDYTYCGAAWQVRVAYPLPGVELKYRKLTGAPTGDSGDPYSGYDRFGRSVDLPWLKTSDSSVIERSQYGFDRDSRRTWQKRPLTDTQDLHHNYDALSQVTASARGSLNLNTTAISAIPAFAESWDYDPTGNWRGYKTDASGTPALNQHRVHDRGNRMTQIEGGEYPVILDRVGRIKQSAPDATGAWGGRLEIMWDAWSRIKFVASNGGMAGSYAYDGLHRRITRAVTTTGVTWHSYYSDAWRPLEERKNAETTPAISYLWGARHRDDLVRRDRAAGGTTLNETRYVLMDYFNPSAITDGSGVVKERYAFSAFGTRSILAPDYTARSTSESAFEFAFQGQFLDTSTGLYNYGYRYYSPYLGRWTCKDPIAEMGGFNLYACVDNGAVNMVDHLGLLGEICCKDGAKPVTDDYGEKCCPNHLDIDNKGKRNCVAAKVNKRDGDGGVPLGGGATKDCSSELAALKKANAASQLAQKQYNDLLRKSEQADALEDKAALLVSSAMGAVHRFCILQINPQRCAVAEAVLAAALANSKRRELQATEASIAALTSWISALEKAGAALDAAIAYSRCLDG